MLRTLSLQSFRIFTSFATELDAGRTLIIGPNACGKSSILEAVRLLSTGESFRAQKTEEMVKFDAEFGRVVGGIEVVGEEDDGARADKTVSKNREDEKDDEDGYAQKAKADLTTTTDILLTRGVLQGQRSLPKYFTINGVRRQRKQLLGRLPSVLFLPDDVRLIEGSPERRRRFIDSVLTQSHPSYTSTLSTYHNALIRRNKTLEQLRERTADRRALKYWDDLVVKHGMILQELRQTFVVSAAQVSFPTPLRATYQPSLISYDRLAQYADREVLAGHTLVGPHKDDVLVEFVPRFGADLSSGKKQAGDKYASDNRAAIQQENAWRSLAQFGSRGQQRMGVVWLKIIEAEWLVAHLGVQPIMLFDDIYSELDETHRAQVERLMEGRQSILTFVSEQDAQALGLENAGRVVMYGRDF